MSVVTIAFRRKENRAIRIIIQPSKNGRFEFCTTLTSVDPLSQPTRNYNFIIFGALQSYSSATFIRAQSSMIISHRRLIHIVHSIGSTQNTFYTTKPDLDCILQNICRTKFRKRSDVSRYTSRRCNFSSETVTANYYCSVFTLHEPNNVRVKCAPEIEDSVTYFSSSSAAALV